MTFRNFARSTAAMMLVFSAASAGAEPLKIALVETLSGPQASTGLLYRDAVKYQIGKINESGGFGGEPIELLEFDNQGGPVGAADRVRAAISEGADVILQGSSSAVAGQVTEDVRKYNLRNAGNEVLYINLGGEAMELTGAKCHYYHFRTSPNAAIRVNTLLDGMKEAGVLGDNVYAMNQNYSWGVDVQDNTVGAAERLGFTVVEQTLHDVNKIQDFSPYVQRVQAAGADTVITGNWSNDLLLLMKASSGAGLDVRFGTAFLDQPGNIGNAGAVAEGHFLSAPFNAEVNPEETSAFMEDYKTVTGHYPSYVEPTTVFGLMLLGEALKIVEPTEDGLKAAELAVALENATAETPMGPISMRADDHQIIQPMIVQKVSTEAKYKADDTEFGFVPIKVISAVDAEQPVQDSCKMKRPS
ncbi:branched-chain amino acid ABC transporter substrate-binding protein [Celeribacter halophilus]|uniref:Branched-chain amino acid transport system substrate-binding protein n=1 Tax=Celeribacter halophilus TaxID=576117 RepID=A0A1I3WSK0_9RHOB|nr:branched-chain amino acid ABC transporter substrate-binding protein [Celeribacter halophilus]PZX06021.1 branched-chain amino acid transport system substrate-binding protein [Celeribacter halophilus]SFK10139.1 branched-chain amino acid transport system substrate-binding protein [Celeribacter halophilus]